MAVSEVIWRDTYYTSTADTLNYKISVDGEVIFAGRAYKYPDSEDIKININKICQNHLDMSLPDEIWTASTVDTVRHPYGFRIFTLSDENNITLQTYRLLYGWNYNHNGIEDQRPYPTTDYHFRLNDPVNGHYSGNQWRPYTIYRNLNGISEVITRKVEVGTNFYHTEVPCGKYALLYLNAKGGWDTFLFEGVCTRTDKIKNYQINNSFNNQTREYEQERYISEIETVYECNTGLLSDEEADRFAWHVMGTNRAYLHNLEEDSIVPVVINADSAKYQTYQSNGKRFAQYKLTIKESQHKIRK